MSNRRWSLVFAFVTACAQQAAESEQQPEPDQATAGAGGTESAQDQPDDPEPSLGGSMDENPGGAGGAQPSAEPSGGAAGMPQDEPTDMPNEKPATAADLLGSGDHTPTSVKLVKVATAAGCQLVAACDLAVASTEAKFATPGVKIGLFCTTPMAPLVRNIPAKIAMEMLLTGQPISAQRACEAGLVNRVVPPDQLDAAVQALVDAIVVSSPQTIRIGKEAFYDQLALDEPEAYRRATTVITDNALQCDAQEGISAFLQKRPPQWSGT